MKSYHKLVYARLGGKSFPAMTITSRSLACFTELYHLFYPLSEQGLRKKVVPANIAELLTIEALAHWIMGDGGVGVDSKHSILHSSRKRTVNGSTNREFQLQMYITNATESSNYLHFCVFYS